MRTAFALIFALLCGSISAPVWAQDVAPQDIPKIELPKSNFVSDFLHDQKDIWTSPLKIKRGDVEWLAPIGIGAAALLATDHKIIDVARQDTGLRPASKFF